MRQFVLFDIHKNMVTTPHHLMRELRAAANHIYFCHSHDYATSYWVHIERTAVLKCWYETSSVQLQQLIFISHFISFWLGIIPNENTFHGFRFWCVYLMCVYHKLKKVILTISVTLREKRTIIVHIKSLAWETTLLSDFMEDQISLRLQTLNIHSLRLVLPFN